MSLIMLAESRRKYALLPINNWWRFSAVKRTGSTGRVLIYVSFLLLNVLGCGTDEPASSTGSVAQLASSTSDAYTFLYNMMDTYATGSTIRLPPSYVSTSTFNAGDVGYLYDSDVMIIALLKRGNTTDLSRAEVLGNAIVSAQAHDPIGDGRLRNSYHTDPFIDTSGSVDINDTGSYTGIQAWTGMALVQLYHSTGVRSYLTAAKSLAAYIQTTTNSTTGSGGYTAGINSSGTTLTYKSTEHQIDLYAFFTMLASVSGDSIYTTDAAHAYTELMALWNSSGYYYIGTLNDGATINTVDDPIPEDIQSWSYLATKLTTHEQSIDWVLTNLSVTSGNFSGVAFDTGDHGTGVWFEGTAHMATALQIRSLSGDATKATTLVDDLENAQSYGPNTDGLGIIAASINGLEADGVDQYYSALHVGATAWYCLAADSANPFTF